MEKNTKNIMKVKLKDGDMVELYTIYDRLQQTYPINGRHDLLMLGHITELRDRLRNMISKCAKRYTLKLEGTELLAFIQLWDRGSIEVHAYLQGIIKAAINNIDHSIMQGRTICRMK
jgi:hypothetical protein